MAFNFGDGFDLYAAAADAIQGYWDSAATVGSLTTLVAGRFAGSQAWQLGNSLSVSLTKTSGVNDAVHHIVCAFRQTATITGSNLGLYLGLFDGATAQCSIVFRSDGAILLTSGGPAGTVLATYTGAFPTINTWYAFEFEIVINNTTGAFNVRKNGNTSNDFASGSIDTQNSANAYANKLLVGLNTLVTGQPIDDLFWRSDASSVAWMGDIRCYTRMPASDASVQFSRTPTVNTQTPVTASTTAAVANGTARYTAFTAAYDGTIGAATVSLGTGYTGNLKCSIFASSGTAPTTVLGSATVVTNPASGSNALTFGTPVAVAKGTQYWIGFDSDTASGTWSVASGTTGLQSTTAYASFPAASPTTSAAAAVVCSLTISVGTNSSVVAEAQQDGTTSYVIDSTVSHADFYNVAGIGSTPAGTIAVTTRGFVQKSDTGPRSTAMQLKSGSTTVQSTPAGSLSAGVWTWLYRTDVTDPNTGAAWTATAVNSAQIGPIIVS
jgi:hypothetical protein